MQSRQDRLLGRDMWKVLHIIAVNFPDGPKGGLSQQRLKGYYDFFNSLQYVLPRAAWRDMWRNITSGGETELDWSTFQALRDHRQLSRWLFAVHDAVREDLKQPASKVSYAKLYDEYKKYRTNAGGSVTQTMNADTQGIDKLKQMLPRRIRAMDTYLENMYGNEYTTWPRARKDMLRKAHVDDAAKWFWLTLSDRAAKLDSAFNTLTNAQRRNRILSQFQFNYRLRHQRIANSITGFTGTIKNTLLS